MRRQDERAVVVPGEVLPDGPGVRRGRRDVLVRVRGGGVRGDEGGEAGIL